MKRHCPLTDKSKVTVEEKKMIVSSAAHVTFLSFFFFIHTKCKVQYVYKQDHKFEFRKMLALKRAVGFYLCYESDIIHLISIEQ
jgi:hypothetical protein